MNIDSKLSRDHTTKLKNIAVICLTESGARLAFKIALSIEQTCDLYIPMRLKSNLSEVDSNQKELYYENWRETFAYLFQQYSQIVCIMATGIVVRSVAPLLESKYSDPAIVVVDEAGQFAISLVSGHVGGANELAESLAKGIHATPVITTATDVQNKPAVDLLALKLEASLEPIDQVKVFNRLLIEDQKVILTSPYPVIQELKQGFVWRQMNQLQLNQLQINQLNIYELSSNQQADAELPTVTISPFVHAHQETKRIQIIPSNLVIGIGCRKGASIIAIRAAVDEMVERFHIHKKSIKAFATIDFKCNEPGIQELVKEWNVPLMTVTKEEIQSLEGEFTPSEWVRKSIGVGGVCEPAARIIAKQGVTIIPKQIINSITISVAMERSSWLDWDQETEITQLLQP